MANPENLKGHEFTSGQSREEAARNGRKGGIASGKARRERKKMREALEELMSREYENSQGERIDGTTLLMTKTFKQAAGGDLRAVEFIRDTIGEKPVEHVDVSGSIEKATAELESIIAGLDAEDDVT